MLPHPAPVSHPVLGFPLFALSKREALLALQSGDGSQTVELYWPEECSDVFTCWCYLEVCTGPYLWEGEMQCPQWLFWVFLEHALG